LHTEHDYLVLSGYLHRRLNRWDEAADALAQAIELDPNNRSLLSQHAQTLFGMRRYQEAIPFFEAGGQRPENLAHARWYLTGDINHLQEGLGEESDFHRWDAAMYVGDWDRALQLVRRLPEVRLHRGTQWLPRDLLEAWVHEGAGRPREAESSYVRAEALAWARLAHAPQDARALSALALVHAGLGDFTSAVREAEAAVDMNPARQDVVQGPHHLFHLAAVYAGAGRLEDATETLTLLLASPNLYNARRVEHDYLMRPLADHVGFQALIDRERERVF
jgi:tetratricopeptide (TPR) repeat protein